MSRIFPSCMLLKLCLFFHDNGGFISVFDAFSFCREISSFILHSQMHTIIFTLFFPMLLLIRKLLLTLSSDRFSHFLLDLCVCVCGFNF